MGAKAGRTRLCSLLWGAGTGPAGVWLASMEGVPQPCRRGMVHSYRVPHREWAVRCALPCMLEVAGTAHASHAPFPHGNLHPHAMPPCAGNARQLCGGGVVHGCRVLRGEHAQENCTAPQLHAAFSRRCPRTPSPYPCGTMTPPPPG